MIDPGIAKLKDFMVAAGKDESQIAMAIQHRPKDGLCPKCGEPVYRYIGRLHYEWEYTCGWWCDGDGESWGDHQGCGWESEIWESKTG